MNKSCIFNGAREKLEIYIANSQFYDLWNNSFKELIPFCFVRMGKYDTCTKFRALKQNILERNKQKIPNKSKLQIITYFNKSICRIQRTLAK
jgi:hypothetical protein